MCDIDVDEIKNDASRCEEFMQLCAALKVFVGDRVNLPDSATLLELFGKVGALVVIMFSEQSKRTTWIKAMCVCKKLSHTIMQFC